ncbi:hypothetical protein MBRA1_000988 [Malassezia brasiliensis]|uniref:Subtelomeric hrmA-associated cluster protein AFUB-079030/YDR124W-like helical bundle domain-containing protein n=1 Tax=Malassezia brasiliensis TaxID=1821822 RepID=A0AAF0DRZ7_9BASI|nr:hypothetical protein MBRA1_000988 [Malassezia brasiliensis]
MPRIPIRVEPYSSPAKQHRHYKCKRDQVLRALGKAAYINGSQFAILLVSARGDVETYASDALQDHLDDWFMKSGVAEEARQLTLDSVPERRNPPVGNLTADDLLDDGQESLSGAATPAVSRMADDPFLESWSTLTSGSEKMTGAEDWSKLLKRTDLTDEAQPIGEASGSAGSPPVPMVPQMSTPVRPPMRPRTGSTGRVAANAHQPQYTIVLKNEAERTAFLEMRFGQLQQVMCKMIAKEWIKVIEPKKQTRYPYNKGEEAKPSWWPKDVRHKEPDHLMKPERHALLLAMLRLNQARIARLQLATAEVVVQIKSGRVSLLMDIYRVAREEENLRDQNLDINTPITVGVSSLEGWEGESIPAADPSAVTESATSSTSQAREDYTSAESLSQRLNTQRKRPRFDSAPEETPERPGGRTNLVNYAAVEPEPQRSSLPGVLPVGNVGQPMKPTRSTPGQMPNSPEAWQMFQAHSHGQPFRMSQPAPSPLAMPPHREGDHRMSWPFAHPASPMYPGNAPAQPTWGMPETPMQQQPMQNLGMSVGSSDVRFSPSFDASFSNSGPMTPSNMSMHLHPVHPHMQAPGSAAMGYHAPPGKSNAMLGTDLTAVPQTQPSEMGPFDVKLEPKPNVRYHGMEEWPCP